MAHNLDRVTKQKPIPVLPKLGKDDKKRIKRVMLTEGYDLRGRAGMIQVVRDTPLCTGYMVFLNRRGNLAYLLHREDVDDQDFAGVLPPMDRFPVPKRFWGSHPEFMRRWFFRKISDRQDRMRI